MPTLCVTFFGEYEGPDDWLPMFGAKLRDAVDRALWDLTDERGDADATLELYVGELFHYEAGSDQSDTAWTDKVVHTGLPRDEPNTRHLCDQVGRWLARGPQ